MRQKKQKIKAIAFTFRPFLADFSNLKMRQKKQQKSKAMAFTFRPFLADFTILNISQKQKKCKAIAFTKLQKVRANSLNFGLFYISEN
jgi:hypothetical protein